MQRSTRVEALKLSHIIVGAVLVVAGGWAFLPVTPGWIRWLFVSAILLGVIALVLSEPFRRGLGTNGAKTYKGLRLPDKVMLHPGHAWAKSEGGEVLVGADDLAVRSLGRPDEVNLPPNGALVLAGEPLFTLKRAGRSLVLRAPLTGTVLGSNGALAQQPGLVDEAPYDIGWVVRLSTADASARGNELLSGQDARDWFRAEVDRLVGTALPGHGPEGAMADGGALVADFHMFLDDDIWTDLSKVFFGATPDAPTWPKAGVRHHGGEMVGRGFYWCPSDGQSVRLESCQVLPGEAARVYYQMPELAVYAMVPFAGLAYIIVFPFLAVATIVALGIQAGVIHARRAARGWED